MGTCSRVATVGAGLLLQPSGVAGLQGVVKHSDWSSHLPEGAEGDAAPRKGAWARPREWLRDLGPVPCHLGTGWRMQSAL